MAHTRRETKSSLLGGPVPAAHHPSEPARAAFSVSKAGPSPRQGQS
jgi:hypothetical protein